MYSVNIVCSPTNIQVCEEGNSAICNENNETRWSYPEWFKHGTGDTTCFHLHGKETAMCVWMRCRSLTGPRHTQTVHLLITRAMSNLARRQLKLSPTSLHMPDKCSTTVWQLQPSISKRGTFYLVQNDLVLIQMYIQCTQLAKQCSEARSIPACFLNLGESFRCLCVKGNSAEYIFGVPF